MIESIPNGHELAPTSPRAAESALIPQLFESPLGSVERALDDAPRRAIDRASPTDGGRPHRHHLEPVLRTCCNRVGCNQHDGDVVTIVLISSR